MRTRRVSPKPLPAHLWRHRKRELKAALAACQVSAHEPIAHLIARTTSSSEKRPTNVWVGFVYYDDWCVRCWRRLQALGTPQRIVVWPIEIPAQVPGFSPQRVSFSLHFSCVTPAEQAYLAMRAEGRWLPTPDGRWLPTAHDGGPIVRWSL